MITAVHGFYVQLVDCAVRGWLGGARCNINHCVRGGVHGVEK